MRKIYVAAFTILIFLTIFLSCSKNSMMPQVSIVVGDNVEYRNGSSHKLLVDHLLQGNDTVVVSEDSKVKISFGNGAIYLNSHSKLQIGSVVAKGDIFRITMHLLEGELYFTQQKQSAKSYSCLFVTDVATIAATETDLNIRYDEKSSRLVVMPLFGSVLITSPGTRERLIASCNRFETYGTEEGNVNTLSDDDVTRLKDWVGKTTIDAALGLSSCNPQAPLAKNLPPEWVKLPNEAYMAGELVVDTISAIDPENKMVTYQLVSGPEGMTLDSISGVIRYKPVNPGTVSVIIRATDSDMQESILDHRLTVSVGLAMVLTAPYMVSPGENFSIIASPAKNMGKNITGLNYRFDCDGDGIFDYPASGKFGTEHQVKKCSISKEGVYVLKVEAKDIQGNIATASCKVVVNQKPKAALKISPLVGTTETEFLLDAEASSDSRDSSADLMVRFDIDNDGQWDIPSRSGFINEKKARCNWNETGSFVVVVQVIDKQGATDTASAKITISRGVKIEYVTCPDTVHVFDTIRFECKNSPSEFAIKSYHWSFDGDTGFEISTNKPVYNHVFRKEGTLEIRCKVVDEKGLFDIRQKKIVIVNSACKVDAGGPYKTNVNDPLTLTGTAIDSDSKIIKYSWDFDGNGKSDWSSDKNGATTYTFQRAGKKMIIFSAETEDGQVVFDSTYVEVTNKPPIAHAGEDIVSRRGKRVKLNGRGQDSDGTIVKYCWDFDGDGNIDWSSTENGVVEHEFQTYSTAVFSVIDSDSCIAYDSVKVIICPDGMQTIEGEIAGGYCVDNYEYPNKKDVLPEMNVTYEEAKAKCAQQGKRLCTATEWENACRNGKEKSNYPYGKEFLLEKCNTLGNPILKNKVSSSGTFYDCHGSNGIYDMSGNAAEWTESVNRDPYVYGGSWQSGESASRCDSKFQLKGGAKYFYVGFRCCK